MLDARERDVLRQAHRHTAVGRAFRRYWLPVLPASQAPPPDGEPVELRVLGEPLVLFRDSSGRLGVLDAYCPHEGGSLAAGLNAGGGLMCMLHGWTFDVLGNRIDSAAVHSGGLRTTAYPAIEHRGVIWIYMGSEQPPPSP